MLDVLLELRIEVTNRNFIAPAHSQVVLKENVDPVSLVVTPANLFAPVFVFVKVLPILLVQRFGCVVFLRPLVQELVLDQIRRQERRATGVERLEN
jgi:hypothetical protein